MVIDCWFTERVSADLVTMDLIDLGRGRASAEKESDSVMGGVSEDETGREAGNEIARRRRWPCELIVDSVDKPTMYELSVRQYGLFLTI